MRQIHNRFPQAAPHIGGAELNILLNFPPKPRKTLVIGALLP